MLQSQCNAVIGLFSQHGGNDDVQGIATVLLPLLRLSMPPLQTPKDFLSTKLNLVAPTSFQAYQCNNLKICDKNIPKILKSVARICKTVKSIPVSITSYLPPPRA